MLNTLWITKSADEVIALFNPHEYQQREYLGYNLHNFMYQNTFNRFRTAHLLKNSYGADGIKFAMSFLGEIGMYRQLPMPDEVTQDTLRKHVSLPDVKRL